MFFGRSEFELRFWTEKNKKKNWMHQVVAQGGWVGTMADVGGRVREGKPSQTLVQLCT